MCGPESAREKDDPFVVFYCISEIFDERHDQKFICYVSKINLRKWTNHYLNICSSLQYFCSTNLVLDTSLLSGIISG